MNDIILVDFGSKFLDNIVEYLQDKKVSFARVFYKDLDKFIENTEYKGMILSGSPCGVYHDDSPSLRKEYLERGIPTLGICYGMQLIAYLYGERVSESEKAEKGMFEAFLLDSVLFDGIDTPSQVGMSHVDRVYGIPKGFRKTAETKDCPIAAMENEEKKIYATQFHPEMGGCGDKVLDNFIYKICKIERE